MADAIDDEVPLEKSGWGITDMQLKFAYEYCVDFNISQAAIRAGYSPAAAPFYGNKVYHMPKVRNAIARILKERRLEYDVTVERLQQEVARIAFSDITKVILACKTGKITLEDLEKLPPSVRAAIKQIRPTKFGIDITFHDKIGALDMLAKHFGYYEKDNEQKKLEGVAIYLPDNQRGDRFDPDQEFKTDQGIDQE